MQLSEKGLALLKQSEGFRSRVYKDVAGFDTIGYGHKVRPGAVFPAVITEDQGDTLLQADLLTAEGAVARMVKVPLTQGQYDALVDFTYNLGAGSLEGSTLLKLLNEGQYDWAAHALLAWDHAGHVEVAGLKVRREAEHALWVSA